MNRTKLALGHEALQTELTAATGSASRLLFVLVAASLAITYICADTLGWLNVVGVSERVDRTRGRSRSEIVALEPILALSDSLRAHPALIRKYRDFIGGLLGIESAADEARRQNRNSNALSAVDPADRALAQDASTGLTDLEIALTMYNNDNLRSEGLGAFQYFLQLFVRPEAKLDSPAAIRHLQGCARVAKSLGHPVQVPEVWPTSLYFSDFIRTAGKYEDIGAAIIAARVVPSPDSLVGRLIEVADVNNLQMSVAGVEYSIRKKEFIVPADSTRNQTIHVSFMPVGVDRNVLILCAPLAVLFLVSLLGSQLERRKLLLGALEADLTPESLALLRSQWLIGRLRLTSWGRKGSSAFSSKSALTTLVLLGFASPLLSYGAVASFLLSTTLPVGMVILGWIVLSTCAVLSVFLLAAALEGQRKELIGE